MAIIQANSTIGVSTMMHLKKPIKMLAISTKLYDIDDGVHSHSICTFSNLNKIAVATICAHRSKYLLNKSAHSPLLSR